jgi:4-aminobutyrate aminotransferase
VCAAAGRAVLATIRGEQLTRCAAERGEQLRWLLTDYAASRRPGAEFVGEVRGRGLCIGVDLVTDRGSRRRAGELARQVVYRAWQLGAVVYYVAANVLEITPPLTITAEETVLAADFISRAIDDAASGVVPPEVTAAYTGWPDRDPGPPGEGRRPAGTDEARPADRDARSSLPGRSSVV